MGQGYENDTHKFVHQIKKGTLKNGTSPYAQVWELPPTHPHPDQRGKEKDKNQLNVICLILLMNYLNMFNM